MGTVDARARAAHARRVTTLDDVLSHVLAPGPMLAFDSARGWWPDHLARTTHYAAAIDRAIVGAARVDRLGFAFAGGYAAALQAMVPSLSPSTLASFAATEEGGVHPRAITTTLTERDGGFRLDGAKKWVTLGPDGGEVLVVAKLAGSSERPVLRVARVDARAAGVTITPLPDTPFVPEIPHASIRFEVVRVDAVLDGDGYDAYLKPFRTIEDIHVHAALWAWLVAIGVRSGWPRELVAAATALLVAIRALASEDPRSPHTHVALGGVIAASNGLVTSLDPSWASVDADLRARWQRDRALLGVASAARAKRLERAWEAHAPQRKA
jgi:hypothetical protein